jgi:transposase
MLLPPSLDDWLPEGHLARFVADLVDEVLDLGPILADYTEKRGYPPYDPRLMVRLLVYGYTTGVRSSRAIERRLADDVAFGFLAAGQEPDFRSIARFRRRHLDALADLFTQSLHLAAKLGMVKMGRVALDGTKLEANASKHKAMSYGRLVDKEERIEAEIAQLEAKAQALLADAEAADEAEDQTFGRDGKEADLPAELDRREKRLAKLQAARAQIEAEAAEKARAHAEDKERRRQERAGTSDERVAALWASVCSSSAAMTAGSVCRSSQAVSGRGRVSWWLWPPRRTTPTLMWSVLVRVTSVTSSRIMRLRSRIGVAGSFQSRGKSAARAVILARVSGESGPIAVFFARSYSSVASASSRRAVFQSASRVSATSRLAGSTAR